VNALEQAVDLGFLLGLELLVEFTKTGCAVVVRIAHVEARRACSRERRRLARAKGGVALHHLAVARQRRVVEV